MRRRSHPLREVLRLAALAAPVVFLLAMGWPFSGAAIARATPSTSFGPEEQLLLYNGSVLPNGSSIPQPTSPFEVVWNGTLGHLFVSDSSGALLVIDPVTHTLVGSYWLGTTLAGLDVVGARDRVYVAEPGKNALAAVNATSGKVVATIPVGSSPNGVVYDPANDRVYVANSAGSNVTVVDPATNHAVRSLVAGSEPTWLGVAPGKDRLFVADWGGASCNIPFSPGACSLLVLNTVTGATVANLTTPLTTELTFDQANGDVYSPNRNNDSVTIVSASSAKIVGTVHTGPTGGGEAPQSATVDSTNGWIYVVNQAAGNYTVINGTTNRMQFATPRTFATDIGSWVYVAKTGHIYGAEVSEPAIFGFAPSNLSISWTFPVSASPWGMVYDPVNGRVYVENQYYCTRDVMNGLSGQRLSQTVYGGACGATQPAVNPRNGTVFGNTATGDVMLNPSNGHTTAIADPFDPNFLFYDPMSENLFGLDAGRGLSITNVSTNTFVRHTTFPFWTMGGIALDGATQVVYVPMTSGSQGSYVDKILKVDGRSGALLGNISIPSGVGNVTGPSVYDPSTGDLFVSSMDIGGQTNHLLVFSVANGSYVKSINLGGQATDGIALDAANGAIYVAIQGTGATDSLVKVSPSTLSVVGTVAIATGGNNPGGVVVDGKTGAIWASYPTFGKVYVFYP
jgi:YVTN family beta-propeller protein